MDRNDGDVVHKCIYRYLVDIHRIRPMVQFPGTLSKYAPRVEYDRLELDGPLK